MPAKLESFPLIFANAQATSSITDDPLAVGRGRVPLIYKKCLALPGTYLAEKLEFIVQLEGRGRPWK